MASRQLRIARLVHPVTYPAARADPLVRCECVRSSACVCVFLCVWMCGSVYAAVAVVACVTVCVRGSGCGKLCVCV